MPYADPARRREKARRYRQRYRRALRAKYREWRRAHPDKARAKDRAQQQRRIRFRDQRLYVKTEPRTGVCGLCDARGRTVRHHVDYDPARPLACTFELCRRCHALSHLQPDGRFG